MSALHLTQISRKIDELIAPHLEMGDQRKGTESYNQMRRSRALAAYIIHHFAGIKPMTAAQSVVDGSEDNGLDAIYFDDTEEKLYLVQSKWISDGRGEPENAAVKKFKAGIEDLLSLNFDRFNEKVRRRSAEIDSALATPTLKVIAILVHTGVADLSDLSIRDFKDLEKEVNDASEIFEWTVVNQKQLHQSLTEDLNSPITAEIALRYWGKVQEPRHAIYGMASAAELGQIWHDYKDRLVAKNLRGSLGDSDVNKEIRQTLEQKSDQFWYFNNGVTATARSIRKLAAGGGSHDLGRFHCEGLYVVNGAQTVSTIGQFLNKNPTVDLANCFVQFRVIELGEGGEEFGDEVTRTNNRQNRIEARDFVSQNSEQKRIRTELAIEGIQYQIMRGEDQVRGEKTFDLLDSTTALACASNDIVMIVTLKAQVGRIWEDLTKAPYRTLFNPNVSGTYVWNCVQIQRMIDESIDSRRIAITNARNQRILTFGNRVISGLTFKLIQTIRLAEPTFPLKEFVDAERIKVAVELISDSVFEFVGQFYGKSIIPTFFKNQTKCRELYNSVSRKHSKSQIFSVPIPSQNR